MTTCISFASSFIENFWSTPIILLLNFKSSCKIFPLSLFFRWNATQFEMYKKGRKRWLWPTLLGKTFYRNERFMLDEKFLWVTIKFAILSNWNENFCMYFFVLLCFPFNECPKQYEKNLDFYTCFKRLANFDILHLNIPSSINLLFLNSVMCVLCANSWFWTSSLCLSLLLRFTNLLQDVHIKSDCSHLVNFWVIQTQQK